MEQRTYVAIDLKSFYASVECIERGYDPLNVNLVVADEGRTDKTIGLAVSPSLKAFGVPGRPRLFEVKQRIAEVNAERRAKCRGAFKGKSVCYDRLMACPNLQVDFVVAPPRMALYVAYSTKIYGIYLGFVAPEDIHVYSIDEVFIDLTDYMRLYGESAEALTRRMIGEVHRQTGITATAGIGSNLYLAKVAMDILAKRMPPEAHGARIATLSERDYRLRLWSHLPLTDFWRIGRGTERRLSRVGLYTMGDIAACSVGEGYHSEALLYKLFGVNAEYLIDHAWGYEPCTIADIKAYAPKSSSVSTGQVLTKPYTNAAARVVVKEMADQLSAELFTRGLLTRAITLTVGYDASFLQDEQAAQVFTGEVTVDFYGRAVPRHAHGTKALPLFTASSRALMEAAAELFDRITDARLPIRRITLCAAEVMSEEEYRAAPRQLDMFSMPLQAEEKEEREREAQEAEQKIKQKYGKNAIFKGMSLGEDATARLRNEQIGGHKA